MTDRTLLILTGLLLAACLCCACLCAAALGVYLVLAPASTTGPSVQPPQAVTLPSPTALPPTQTSTQTPAAPSAACTASMQNVIHAAEGSAYATDPGLSEDSPHPDSVTLVFYPVTGDTLGEPRYRSVKESLQDLQHDAASQSSAWALFTRLIPSEQRRMVSGYEVFTDGAGSLLASVQQSYDDPALWSVAVDAADLADRPSLTFTLVHEFAHLLTLSASQVPPDVEVYHAPEDRALQADRLQACPTYFPGEGCSLEGSYINLFHQRFWTALDEEWRPIDDLSTGEDIEAYYEALYAFYEAHQDQFVGDYAATNPSEDMAETFSYFIFDTRPDGDTIAEQKVLFFYEYPGLVQLRGQILQAFCEVPQ